MNARQKLKKLKQEVEIYKRQTVKPIFTTYNMLGLNHRRIRTAISKDAIDHLKYEEIGK